MYKEYRDVSRTLAVQSLYQDMAARHRARFRSIHVCISLSCAGMLIFLGYPSCRDPEDGGCQTSLYPTIALQELEVSSSSSLAKGCWKEGLLSAEAIYMVIWKSKSEGRLELILHVRVCRSI